MPMTRSQSTPGLAGNAIGGFKIDPNFIPNLPGNKFEDRVSKKYFPRLNTWSMIGGCRIERDREE